MNNRHTIKDILASWMENARISANELSRRTGISQPTITRILGGESKDPETRTLEAIAASFGRSVAELRGELLNVEDVRGKYSDLPMFSRSGTTTANLRPVPLISWVQAGNWSDVADPYATGNAEDWLPCPVPHSPGTFALRVRGISMEPDFHDGDYIFVDPSTPPRNRSHVIVRLPNRDEATFKQLIVEEGRRFLKPLNPSWPEPLMEITEEAHVSGVVVFTGRKL